jgi:hypothetical protein
MAEQMIMKADGVEITTNNPNQHHDRRNRIYLSSSLQPDRSRSPIRRSLGMSQTSGARFAKQYDLNLSEPDE